MEKRMDPDDSPEICKAVAAVEGELADTGRVVLRASGTEPVIRVMVEGQDRAQVAAMAKRLAAVVEQAAS
ncbi:MAG: phosphoglucosamine mutase, partial [Pseudomonas stutzeri]|nr:phosphoglucosamine mutase [Stutzerimonas stutzeri]